eukprot:745798-Hanusia_phi.AAC.2
MDTGKRETPCQRISCFLSAQIGDFDAATGRMQLSACSVCQGQESSGAEATDEELGVVKPLAAVGNLAAPEVRRRSFRSHKPTAAAMSRKSPVNVLPSNSGGASHARSAPRGAGDASRVESNKGAALNLLHEMFAKLPRKSAGKESMFWLLPSLPRAQGIWHHRCVREAMIVHEDLLAGRIALRVGLQSCQEFALYLQYFGSRVHEERRRANGFESPAQGKRGCRCRAGGGGQAERRVARQSLGSARAPHLHGQAETIFPFLEADPEKFFVEPGGQRYKQPENVESFLCGDFALEIALSSSSLERLSWMSLRKFVGLFCIAHQQQSGMQQVGVPRAKEIGEACESDGRRRGMPSRGWPPGWPGPGSVPGPIMAECWGEPSDSAMTVQSSSAWQCRRDSLQAEASVRKSAFHRSGVSEVLRSPQGPSGFNFNYRVTEL